MMAMGKSDPTKTAVVPRLKVNILIYQYFRKKNVKVRSDILPELFYRRPTLVLQMVGELNPHIGIDMASNTQLLGIVPIYVSILHSVHSLTLHCPRIFFLL